MIIRECDNFESVIHFYRPFEYTYDIAFLYSIFHKEDLVHCCIMCPKDKIFFNLWPYKNISILRERALSRLSNQQKNNALRKIRKATGINRIKDLHYGGDGQFVSTFISRRSLENVISYFELQEKTFGDLSVMSWDGFPGWFSDPIVPTPFKERVERSNGNYLPIIDLLIKCINENTLCDVITKDDYRCLDKVLDHATSLTHLGELTQLRAMDLINKLNFPMFFDHVLLCSHPSHYFFESEKTQNNPIWTEFLAIAHNYTQKMKDRYPFLIWDLESPASDKKYFEDIIIAYNKYAFPNWHEGERYDDYGRLIASSTHLNNTLNNSDEKFPIDSNEKSNER